MSRSFDRMLTNIVSLIKPNGQRYDNIMSLVSPNMIFIGDTTLPIDEGDKIVRELSDGVIETYIVLDRSFYEKFGSIAVKNYQVRVRKEVVLGNK